ncbi:hypothetical protein ACFFRS_03895 [Saccharopolyspora hordei]|uniref:hypothetical protein n=1 Tax=Saccharopolyspora hordei TaxID=1838 RepID=UPI0035EB2F2B
MADPGQGWEQEHALGGLVVPPVLGAEPLGSEDVDRLRRVVSRLVGLDAQHGGRAIAPLAARVFRATTALLAAGRYAPSVERDLLAVTAELGEVAGSAGFDSARFDAARGLNRQALRLARLAGDRGMELFVLGNTALQAHETGRPRAALDAVELMETRPLSPRLRALAGLRRARAAAALGDDRAFAVLARARSDLSDGVHRTDPEWSWWVTDRELAVHEGEVWRAVGEPAQAVERYAAAVGATAERYRWARFIGGAFLLDALVGLRDWRDAEHAALALHRLAEHVGSGRAALRIRAAASAARRGGAPSSLDDTLVALVRRTS